MSDKKLVDLRKKVVINLSKVTKAKVITQVAYLGDVSGSTKNMHKNGIIQRLLDRLFAVAIEFDDNGVLDAWVFDDTSQEVEPIVESMFGNYVAKYIMPMSNIWNSTSYAPGMQMIIDHYYPGPGAVATVTHEVAEAATGLFGKMKSMFSSKPAAPAPAPSKFKPAAASVKLPDPVYVMVQTDGDNDDKSQVRQLLEANKDKQIFWMLIGITDSHAPSFTFLKELAAKYPNVDFFNAGEIDKVDDDTLYSSLLTKKFATWYEACRKAV